MQHPEQHPRSRLHGFMPPYVIQTLSRSEDADERRVAFDTMHAGAVGNTTRIMNPTSIHGRSSNPGTGRLRFVFDMDGSFHPLPGEQKRREGQAATGQTEVDEAFDNAGTTYAFLKAVLRRESIDGAGYALISSVNYGFKVGDAFWDGERMIYGAGDGKLFLPFTRSLGIAAHEMSHGVLSFESTLDYEGQSGALNESFCDVMGTSVEQYAAKSQVTEASWCLGAEVAGPVLAGIRGFRSFDAEPAYRDHERIGTDPQPKHMDQFVATTEDRGGVHVNSGIPNHAFYLAAMELGGAVWERATRIWFDAFTSLGRRATFVQAAAGTAAAARRMYGEREERAVADAWRAVGVDQGARP